MSKIQIFGFYCLLIPSLLLSNVCPPKNCGYNAPYKKGPSIDFYFEIDFLYWQGIEEGLSLGSTTSTVITPCFTFGPGVRALAGCFFGCDHWSLQGEYAHFIRDSKTFFEGESILPYWASTDERFSSASSKWTLKFDEAALSLARDSYVGKCTTSKVHIGLLGMWIRQDYDVAYQNPSTLLKSDNQIKSWAVGPRIGVDTKWFLFRNFQIFTDIRGAMVYSDYYQNEHKVYSNQEMTQIASYNDAWYLRPLVNMNMGVGFGHQYKRFCFDLKAGYSATILWNQNVFLQNISCFCSGNGNLYLQGLTLYFTFYF